MGKRELIALLNLSSWCLVMVERLFLAVPRGCLQFVIVVFPDHTHLLFFLNEMLVIRAEIHKVLARIANIEGHNQQSDLGLSCLSRPFWHATRAF